MVDEAEDIKSVVATAALLQIFDALDGWEFERGRARVRDVVDDPPADLALEVQLADEVDRRVEFDGVDVGVDLDGEKDELFLGQWRLHVGRAR